MRSIINSLELFFARIVIVNYIPFLILNLNAFHFRQTDGVTGITYSYRRLSEMIRSCASALVKRGLKKGDIVAIISPNTIDWPVIYLAILAFGGIITTCNHMYTEHELSHQLKDSGAQYLVAAESCIPTIKKLDLTFKEKFVFGSADGYTSYTDLTRWSENVRNSFIEVRMSISSRYYLRVDIRLPYSHIRLAMIK